jgi:hypothetical protein
MAKKKEIYFGKGFKRIYFTLSAIWIIATGFTYLDYLDVMPLRNVFIGLIFVFAPIPIWFILTKWFIAGFKK